jgi:hypothetical protein
VARTSTPTIEQRVNALEQRMHVVESERPGRKPLPMLAIRQRDVCAVDPGRDSSTCPNASIYRYQSGCHGAACRMKQHLAYERRKNSKLPEVEDAFPPDKKAPPFKKGGKPAPTKKGSPAKRQPAKKAAAIRPPTKRAAKAVEPTPIKRVRKAPVKTAARPAKVVSKRPSAA